MSLRSALAAAAAITLAPALPAFSQGAADVESSGALTSGAMQMSDQERLDFRAEIRAYLLDNPEVIMEAVNLLEARKQEAQVRADLALVAANIDVLTDDGYSFVGGNPDGDITVVEFMDYRCTFCRRAFPEVEELVNADGNIRFVVKEFPILGPQSDLSARFALSVQALHGDAVYKDVHDALMQMQTDYTPETLARLAEGFGLDAAAIEAGMDAPGIERIIAANRLQADNLRITGTPTFIIGGRMVRGYLQLDQMEQIVAEEREMAG
ncbi:MAG: DsbA family protein [Rubellimicrobium sp.]|nr:DsbA family protein [Rubellimicrobium sp.]